MPENSLELYHEALEDYRLGRQAGAAEKLEQVLAQDPGLEDAWEALSVIYYNLEKYDEAIRVLKQWIKVNRDTVMAHTNLSRCYVAKGMIAEAEQEQAEARRLTWKAELKEKKQTEPSVDLAEQVTRYRKIIAMDPADVLGWFSLGKVYAQGGKKREAVDTFEQAVQVDPGHSSSYLELGQALEALGDKKKAAGIYTRGIRIAEEKGAMMPQKKMESRLRALESSED